MIYTVKQSNFYMCMWVCQWTIKNTLCLKLLLKFIQRKKKPSGKYMTSWHTEKDISQSSTAETAEETHVASHPRLQGAPQQCFHLEAALCLPEMNDSVFFFPQNFVNRLGQKKQPIEIQTRKAKANNRKTKTNKKKKTAVSFFF